MLFGEQWRTSAGGTEALKNAAVTGGEPLVRLLWRDLVSLLVASL